MAGKTKKGYIKACIYLTPTTTKSEHPAGPNTMLIGKRSIRIIKILKLKPILLIFLINQLAGTFPYPKYPNISYPPR